MSTSGIAFFNRIRSAYLVKYSSSPQQFELVKFFSKWVSKHIMDLYKQGNHR